MNDNLIDRLENTLAVVSTSPARTLPGAGGQTLEDTAKATIRQISDWQIETLFEVLDHLKNLDRSTLVDAADSDEEHYAHSETVERFNTYEIMMSRDGHEPIPTPDGDWVRFDDYQARAAECDKCARHLAEMAAEIESMELARAAAVARAEVAEAKLKRAVEMFDYIDREAAIQAYVCCGNLARAAIKEIKGEER